LNIPDDANISTLLFSIKVPLNGITKTLMEMNKTNKISGRFDGDKLKIITSDPKFIKTILIKEFSSFVNRDTDSPFFKCRSFKLLQSILFEKDEEWKKKFNERSSKNNLAYRQKKREEIIKANPEYVFRGRGRPRKEPKAEPLPTVETVVEP
jgi:hypothetical protein